MIRNHDHDKSIHASTPSGKLQNDNPSSILQAETNACFLLIAKHADNPQELEKAICDISS